MSNKQWVVVGAVVVVVAAVGYAAMTGLFPPRNGQEGTIGAASRYQSQQISDADVALQDAKIQSFLQSDVFHKMATNAAFRKNVEQNKAELLRKLYAKVNNLDGADLSELLDGAEVAELMNESELLNAVAGDELFRKIVKDQEVIEMAKRAKGVKQEGGFEAELLRNVKKQYQEAGASELEKKGAFKLFESGAFVELLSEGYADELLSNPEALELLSDDGLAEMFNDSDLQSVLMDQSVMDALEHAPAEMLSEAVMERSAKVK